MIALFRSDGCTLYSWIHEKLYGYPPPFQKTLCLEHDRAYWNGGTFGQKLKADWIYFKGVWAAGYPIAATISLILLTVFSPLIPFIPNRHWRWGGGYDYPQWYFKRKE